MESKELALGIRLYSNVELPCKDTILGLDFDGANRESVIVNDEFRANYDSRITLSIDVPYTNKDNNQFTDIFRQTFDLVEQDYMSIYGISLKSHNPYKILKYDVGGKFDTHMDDGGGNFRRVSTVYYLNDNYEGGEIEFPRFNVKYKPKENDMIIFPSTYTYNHAVSTITSGERYCIISWLN